MLSWPGFYCPPRDVTPLSRIERYFLPSSFASSLSLPPLPLPSRGSSPCLFETRRKIFITDDKRDRDYPIPVLEYIFHEFPSIQQYPSFHFSLSVLKILIVARNTNNIVNSKPFPLRVYSRSVFSPSLCLEISIRTRTCIYMYVCTRTCIYVCVYVRIFGSERKVRLSWTKSWPTVGAGRAICFYLHYFLDSGGKMICARVARV